MTTLNSGTIKDQTSGTALDGEPIISLSRDTGVRAAFDAACSKRAVTPRIVLEATALPMVAQLAAHDLGGMALQ